ncbi:MAG TPA: 16S rRNA (guanine(527)-N(7))-methyltransferase RsmG [Casimicrobiaceae bacterium]|nr:16S rRNA (guanine(527)-N(7))-methyltransferase RsmG [Casimicrobiaceae bacterium]
MNRALAGGVAALGLEIDTAAQTKLLAYLALLDKWNRTHNLTAIREPERMVTHHLLDALATLQHLPLAATLRLIDVGSGGGLPGLPLAIARPQWRITLLDSNGKKAAFLRQAAAELGIANVAIAAMRAEDYVPDKPFDVAISRAFADLAQFAAAARHLVRPGGQLFAMKGVYPREELQALPCALQVVAVPALEVPGLGAERHLVIMRAITET